MGLFKRFFVSKEIITPAEKRFKELRSMVSTTYTIMGSAKDEDNWFRITNFSLDKIDKVKTEKDKEKVEKEVVKIFIDTFKDYVKSQEKNTEMAYKKAIKNAQENGIPREAVDKRFQMIKEQFPILPKAIKECYDFFLEREKEIKATSS